MQNPQEKKFNGITLTLDEVGLSKNVARITVQREKSQGYKAKMVKSKEGNTYDVYVRREY
jgi:hypothetical protein